MTYEKLNIPENWNEELSEEDCDENDGQDETDDGDEEDEESE